MASLPNLTDEFIADSYKGVLHTSNQPVTGATLRQVYDGLGNPTALKISADTVGFGNFVLPTNGVFGQTFLVDPSGNLIFGNIFPIGSVYFTVTDANPQTYLGGVWVRIAQGRFIAGVGTGSDGTYSRTLTAGNTGGTYEHRLTIEEMPAHSHGMDFFSKLSVDSDMGGNQRVYHSRTSISYEVDTENTGDGETHENTPPAFGLYVWARTA
jgi:hypothetical protein